MLVFLLIVVLMTAAGSYFSVRRAFDRFQRRQEQIARETAQAVDDQLAKAWQQGGGQALLQAMNQMGEAIPPHRIRWVWFEQTQVSPGKSTTAVVEQLSIHGKDLISKTTTDQHGQRHLQTFYPIDIGDGPRGGLEVTGSLASHDAATRDTIFVALTSLGVIALTSVGLAYYAGVFWVARPLDQLIAKTERIASGDFGTPIPVKGNDELGQLARALNRMSDQLAAQQQQIRDETAGRLATLEQLRHADRLKTVGRLAAGLAHELGTPLNVVSGRAGLIASGKLSGDEIIASAEIIKSEAVRVTSIIRQLLDFARPSKSQREHVDVGQLLQETLTLLEPLAEKRQVMFEAKHVAGLSVSADRGQLQQVLTNILVNAIQAMPRGGTVTTELRQDEVQPPGDHSGPSRHCVVITITDQGNGIRPEDREQIFEPFFTTKEVGEGTGLGLSIAYGIVQEHGGWIEIESEPGKGSCFAVYLPQE